MATSRETIGGTGEDPQGRAERALVKVFLSMRAYHLVAAGMSMSLDRKRYRRPALATALLAGSVGESAWLTWRHLLCRRPLDSRAMLVDTLVNGSTFAACSVAVAPDEQFTPVNWAFPVTLWTVIALPTGFARRGAAGAATALMGAYSVTTWLQTGGVSWELPAVLLQYMAGWVMGDLIIRRIRSTASAIADLDAISIERAGEIAEREERAQLHRKLHEGAVMALEAVLGNMSSDRATARRVAGAEASRLRRALRGEDDLAVLTRIEAVVADGRARGLGVEVISSDLAPEDDPGEPGSTLIGTVLAALLGGCDPASGDGAVVRLTAEVDGPLQVTFRYRGAYTERPTLAEACGAFELEGGSVRLSTPARGGVRCELGWRPNDR